MAFDPVVFAAKKGSSLSEESVRIIIALRDILIAEGLKAGKNNYPRQLAEFLLWAEGQGYDPHSLPADSVESYLRDALGDKAPATRDTARQYLRTIGNRLLESKLADWSHVKINKNEAAPLTKEQREERKRRIKAATVALRQEREAEERTEALESLPPGAHLRKFIAGAKLPSPVVMPQAQNQAQEDDDLSAYEEEVPEEFLEEVVGESADEKVDSEPTFSADELPPSSPPPSEASQFNSAVVDGNQESQMSGVQQQPPPQVIVIPQQRATAARVTQAAGMTAHQPAASGNVTMNVGGVNFRGPYLNIYRVMDGSIPGTLAGQEVLVETAATAAVARHGTAEAYLQRTTLPRLAKQLAPGTSVVQFVVNELNAAKQPTNVRAEVAVALTSDVFASAGMGGMNGAPAMPQQQYLFANAEHTMPGGAAAPSKTEDIWLKKIEAELEAAKKREEKAAEEAKNARDAQSLFMLQQQQQREMDLRRQLEEMQRRIEQGMMAPPMLPPPLPMPLPESNGVAEALRAANEQSAKFAELMAAVLSKPQPPQKDASEWLIPLMQENAKMAQENARMMQAQSQENMKMLLAMQEAQRNQAAETQKLILAMQETARQESKASTDNLIAILTRKPEESETEKMVKTMILKKLTDDESGMDKMAKSLATFQSLAERMGMGGGGPSTLETIFSNLPAMLAGAAKLQQSSALAAQVKGPKQQGPGQGAVGPLPQQRLPQQTRSQPQPQPQPHPQQTRPTQTTLVGIDGGKAEGKMKLGEVSKTPPANPEMQVSDELRTATATLLAAAKDAEDNDDDAAFIMALRGYVEKLAEENPEQAKLLLSEFFACMGYEDVAQVAKYALIFGGIVQTREDKLAVTDCLHRQYSLIHYTLGGGQKILEDADRWEEEEEDEEEDEEQTQEAEA